MRASNDLAGGFRIVADYDPDTYARMLASPWHVTTDAGNVLAQEWGAWSAFGITTTGRGAGARDVTFAHPFTWINLALIRDSADLDLVVPVNYLLADVLVHEFAHTSQLGPGGPDHEVPAFAAGASFASKLPAQYGVPIGRLSDQSAVYET